MPWFVFGIRIQITLYLGTIQKLCKLKLESAGVISAGARSTSEVQHVSLTRLAEMLLDVLAHFNTTVKTNSIYLQWGIEDECFIRKHINDKKKKWHVFIRHYVNIGTSFEIKSSSVNTALGARQVIFQPVANAVVVYVHVAQHGSLILRKSSLRLTWDHKKYKLL